MKPLIYKRHGLWYCRIVIGVMAMGRMGIGYSPQGAYEDWFRNA
jgi:hypothetical protein